MSDGIRRFVRRGVDKRNRDGLFIDAFPEAAQGVHLKFRAKTLQGKVGRGLASFIRKSVRRGVTPTGRALPRGLDGGRPWRDQGDLLRSITFKKGLVTGWGPHYSGMRAAGLIGVLVFGRTDADSARRAELTPFERTQPVIREVNRLLDKEMTRQLKRGAAKITFGPGRSTSTRGSMRFTRRRRR